MIYFRKLCLFVVLCLAGCASSTYASLDCKKMTTIALFTGDPGLITYAHSQCRSYFDPSIYVQEENSLLLNALITAFNKLSLNAQCKFLSAQQEQAFKEAFPSNWQVQLKKYIERFKSIPPEQERKALAAEHSPALKNLFSKFKKNRAFWEEEAYHTTTFHYLDIKTVESIILNLLTGINLLNQEALAMAFSTYNILYP